MVSADDVSDVLLKLVIFDHHLSELWVPFHGGHEVDHRGYEPAQGVLEHLGVVSPLRYEAGVHRRKMLLHEIKQPALLLRFEEPEVSTLGAGRLALAALKRRRSALLVVRSRSRPGRPARSDLSFLGVRARKVGLAPDRRRA